MLVQGDVFLVKGSIPNFVKPVAREPRGFVLAEGEHTGHAHVIEDDIEVYEDEKGTMWIRCAEISTLTHEEHKPITIEPGEYQVGRILEYDPFTEEARRVQD